MGIFDTATPFTTPTEQPVVPAPRIGVSPFSQATPFDSQAYQALPTTYAGVTADSIRTNPESMQTIRDYMTRRKGAHVNDYTDEELYDTYINHMRSFNVNEVTTGGELLWVRRASDEDRQLANQAYGIFDSLGSVFTNDGISGAFDGVKDYVWSTAWAPSTWLGAVVGKMATAPARAAAREAAANVVTSAVRNRGTAAVGDAATEVAVNVAQQEARNISIQAARQSAIREVAIGVAGDAALSTTQDVMRQLTLMNVGAQDRYSAIDTVLNTATALVGGLPPGVSYITRQADAVDISTRAAVVAQRNAEAALERVRPEIEKALEEFDGQMIDWMKAVESGRTLNRNDYDLVNKSISTLLDTDPANRASIVGAMQRAGVVLKDGDLDVGKVEQIASFARNISPEKKANLDNVIGKHLNGLTFDGFVDIMVAGVSQSGTNLSIAQKASAALTNVVVAKGIANDEIVGLAGEAMRRGLQEGPTKASTNVIGYVQSLWRRALVSHPATTMVNVAGWAQVEAFKSLADVLHGGVLGTVGLAAKLASPVSAKAGKWADKALLDSASLRKNQLFKIRTLFSPTSTRDIFDAVLTSVGPKRAKKLEGSLYGGIDGTSETYGISKTNKVVSTAEDLLDKAGRISFLKVQDVYTKSNSFVFELDKQLRLLNNTTLGKVLKDGDLSTISDDIFQKAVDATLKSTMSYDYGKSKAWFNWLATAVERFSNMPIFGFLFPFGKFMNNQLGFVLEYTPLAGIQIATDMARKGIIIDSEIIEQSSKAMVGLFAFMVLAQWDKKGQEEGRAWYEVEDSIGRIINVQNMAPISAYMAGARFWNAWSQGQLTPELKDELVAQLGALSMMNTLQQDPIGGIVNYINSSRDDQTSLDMLKDISLGLLTFSSGIVAGFTRPLEPLDATLGFVMNSDHAVDRRLLSGTEAAYRGATRYVENFFANVLSEPVDGQPSVNPVRQDATQFGPVRDPNPLSRLLGVREQPETTNIHRLLNMVNIPSWTIQERSGVPEWDTLVNEIITPRLEQEAIQLMNSRLFKQGDLATRERLVRQLLRHTREQTIDMVQSEMGVEENLLRMRQAFVRKPLSLRRKAMEDLNITTNERELSFIELEQLTAYITMIQDQEKAVIEN